MNFREHHRYHLASEDGYYAIDVREAGGFTAFHIPALWAREEPIGTAPTSEEAARICENHATRPKAA
jgi:hypothetical protein